MAHRHVRLAVLFTLVATLVAACGGGGGGGGSAPPPPAPSGLSYTSPNVFTVGQAIAPLSPTVTGTVTAYSVNPALPNGLALNTSSGAISGTPAAATATTTFTVTASNPGGQITATLAITVNDVAPAVRQRRTRSRRSRCPAESLR